MRKGRRTVHAEHMGHAAKHKVRTSVGCTQELEETETDKNPEPGKQEAVRVTKQPSTPFQGSPALTFSQCLQTSHGSIMDREISLVGPGQRL